MARTAEQVQTELDALRSRQAKGIFRVRHGDTETHYQTAADMTNAIKLLESELATLQTTRTQAVRFQTSKGL